MPDVAAVAAYERDFESVKYGRSRLLYVECRLMLYASPLDATVARAGIGAVVNPGSSSFKSLLTLAVAHSSGLPLKSYAVRRNAAITLPGTDGREAGPADRHPARARRTRHTCSCETGALVRVYVDRMSAASSIERATATSVTIDGRWRGVGRDETRSGSVVWACAKAPKISHAATTSRSRIAEPARTRINLRRVGSRRIACASRASSTVS